MYLIVYFWNLCCTYSQPFYIRILPCWLTLSYKRMETNPIFSYPVLRANELTNHAYLYMEMDNSFPYD